MAFLGLFTPNVEKLRSKRDVAALVKVSNRGSNDMRRAAIKALGEIGDVRAVEPLVSALKDHNWQDDAIDALVRIGPPAVERLVAALADKNVIYPAACVLERIGWSSAKPLVAALMGNEPSLAFGAASVLGKIGDARAVEPLITALKKQHGMLDFDGEVTKALVEVGKPAVERLIAALKDDDLQVRIVAIVALGEIRDPRAIESLLELLNEEPWPLVADALEKLGWNPDKSEIGAAYWIARGIPHECAEIGAPAVELLISTLQSSDRSIACQAAGVLGKIGDARAVEPLISALKKDGDLRQAAARSLGEIGDTRAVEALVDQISPKNIYTDIWVSALEQIGSANAFQRLLAKLEENCDHPSKKPEENIKAKIRDSLTRILSRIGAEIPEKDLVEASQLQAVTINLENYVGEEKDEDQFGRFSNPIYETNPGTLDCSCLRDAALHELRRRRTSS